VLSPNVCVHSWAQVEESVLLDGVSVGRHCRIRRAIIDKGVSIPPGTIIGHDPEQDRKRFTVTDSGIVVIPKFAPMASPAGIVCIASETPEKHKA
jgi:glucose-1-phosphate adenylyltransferase